MSMTDKQAQALLIYLGYSPGSVDGIAGVKTNYALSEFATDYGLTGKPPEEIRASLVSAVAGTISPVENPAEVVEAPLDDSDPFYGIKHFVPGEFRCKCNGLCQKDTAQMSRKLLTLADAVREHFNAPVTVTSGIRCPKHNANVRGVSNSRHLSGRAMDFVVRGFSAQSVLAYVQHLSGVRYSYAIDSTAVHMDVE